MSYRDPLEAAHARIALLEAQVGELMRTAADRQIRVHDLEAKLLIQKHEAERTAAQAAAHAAMEEAQHRQEVRTETSVLEARVAALEAELEAAYASIARLQARLDEK